MQRVDEGSWIRWVSWGVAIGVHIWAFSQVDKALFLPSVMQPTATRIRICLPMPAFAVVAKIEEKTDIIGSAETETKEPLTQPESPVQIEEEKPEPKGEPDPELEVEPKVEPEPEPKEELEVEPEPEPKVEPEPEPKEEPEPEPEPEVEPEPAVVEDRVDVDGVVDEMPRARRAIRPIYPMVARQQRLEGDVVCAVCITKRGRVESVTIEKSSGHAVLDQSAVRAIRATPFDPARHQGRPIAFRARLTLSFQLDNRAVNEVD